MIDWTTLAAGLGFAADSVRAVPLAGGNINRAFRLEAASNRCFVKLNQAEQEPMFVAEKYALELIRASGAIRVPQVYATGCEDGYAYIAMEYIDLSGAPGPAVLARALAALHSNTRAQYGFDIDNTIGSSPQVNRPGDDWPRFWREQRLGYQLDLARRNGLPTALIDAAAQLSDHLDRFFVDYQPAASLLHGDLWSGNYAADESGAAVIYDPASYYGDHETDLAMMELFGNPGDEFFAVYRQYFPIDAGYPLRRSLYNLYHLLNHANLFGGGYVDQSRRLIERLLAEVC